MNLTASEARAKLFPLIEELNQGADPVLITSKNGNAVLLSESEYSGLLETLYITSNPQNAIDIKNAEAQLARGEGFLYHPPADGGFATFTPLVPAKKAKQASAAKRAPKREAKKVTSPRASR